MSFALPSGTLRAQRFGDGAALTLCGHGLSANCHSFGFLGETLGSRDRTVIAPDLRGRGLSDVTPAGTYGWDNHAQDVVAIADALGVERFDYVGHSMGAYIGMALARRAPKRIRRMVLIDAVGLPDPLSLVPIAAAVRRLGVVHASADAFVDAVRRLGTIEPWSDHWERHYRYEVVATSSGVRSRTDSAAVLEDMVYASTQSPHAMWPALTMETLLLRASRPIGGGFIVTVRDRDAFVTTAPRARAVEIDANHYGVVMHEETGRQIARFLA
ncbi:MAG TPA: alpha/beta fold hydrolase [Polyangiaceae bacterium]|nr:alpha/beta fold hydrolase [Polyangiaceae bacterium]